MRSLARIVLVCLLVAVGLRLAGLWPSGWSLSSARTESPSRTVGTSGSIDTERARERGAEISERAAVAAKKIEETIGEAALTTKIKAKMALDDSVKARAIDVSTTGTTVTLAGQVRSLSERDRAVALARETSGVTHVTDSLVVVSR